MYIRKYYNNDSLKHLKALIKETDKGKDKEKIIDVKKLFKLLNEHFAGFDEYVMDYYNAITSSKLNPKNYERIWKILLEHISPIMLLRLKKAEFNRIFNINKLKNIIQFICQTFKYSNCIDTAFDYKYKIGIYLDCSNKQCIHNPDKCPHTTIEEQRSVLIELNTYLDEFIDLQDNKRKEENRTDNNTNDSKFDSKCDEDVCSNCCGEIITLRQQVNNRLSVLENDIERFINDTIKNICVKFQVIFEDMTDVDYTIVESNFIDETDSELPFIVFDYRN